MSSIFWFRRDLRLQDNEALTAAFSEPGGVAGVYMLDKADYLSLEGIRQHSLSEGPDISLLAAEAVRLFFFYEPAVSE